METLSAAAVVEEFVDRWCQSDLRNKMPQPMVIDNGGLVELTAIGVYAAHQRKGFASQALRMLTDLCDANGLRIELVVRPLESEFGLLPGCPALLSIEELADWYGRHGFVDAAAPDDDTHKMVRLPSQK